MKTISKRRLDSVSTEIGDHCLAMRARRLGRTITALYDTALQDQNLTIGQMTLLAAIARLKQITAGELTELLSLEKSTLSRNLNRMQRDNLIRVTLSEDQRSKRIELNAKGQEALVAALPHWRKAQRAAKKLLGTKGTEGLLEATRAV